MSRSRSSGQPVKVVIINTEYIKTDATSFKSVVQRLTGKDAPPATTTSYKNNRSPHVDGDRGGGGGRGGVSSPVLQKGMSFRDLDKLLLELPAMDDDIYHFWAD